MVDSSMSQGRAAAPETPETPRKGDKANGSDVQATPDISLKINVMDRVGGTVVCGSDGER